MKLGIYGYGNLGKGVENAITKNPDIELIAVFTRREPETVQIKTENAPVVHTSKVLEWQDKIDVMIICGGSATDLPTMTPFLAEHFNVVDSYDNHKNILSHYEKVNKSALKGNKTALISCGWDPGMFSLIRLYGKYILPEGKGYTFWGKGVSQGHSDAIRRIDGVIDARQYTVPIDEAFNKVRNGLNPELSLRDRHIRECYVVAHKDADKERIREEIVNMPDYFKGYNTTVTFISEEEMKAKHSGLPHGGCVINTGITGNNNKHVIEYKISLDSNPEFTGSILVVISRAVYRMAGRGELGCKTVLDVAPIDLAVETKEEIIREFV